MGVALQRYEINHSVVLTEEQQEYILKSIVLGISIRNICAHLNIPLHHVYDYAAKDPFFDKKMDRARVYQAHILVDELMSATVGCKTMAEVSAAKVWSDNAKWVASKIEPAKYGEKLDINITHLDLSAVLLAAENRIIPILQAKTNALTTDILDIEPLSVDGELPRYEESRPISQRGEPINAEIVKLGDSSVPDELKDLI